MRINIYAHLIIIEILDEIYARAQNWSTVEYSIEYHDGVMNSCIYSILLQYYCRVERNKTWDIAVASDRRDHRKSKFGLHYAIKLI